MKKIISCVFCLFFIFSFSAYSKPLYIFTSHASVGAASGVFWQAV